MGTYNPQFNCIWQQCTWYSANKWKQFLLYSTNTSTLISNRPETQLQEYPCAEYCPLNISSNLNFLFDSARAVLVLDAPDGRWFRRSFPTKEIQSDFNHHYLILTGRVKLYLHCKAISAMTDFSSYTLKEQLISRSLWLSEFFLNLK